VVLLAGVAWLGTRRKDVPHREPLFDVLLPEPIALAPGVYLLGRTSPAAVYAVQTSAGLVLIDSGVEANAATVIAQLSELGLDVKQVRAILLTHVHADHSNGAAHLRSLTGARAHVGRADSQALRAGAPREAFVSTFHMPHYAPHSTPVDVELTGNETLSFGETNFEVIATPGHSPGSVCYLLERPGLRALFAGDVIQALSLAGSGRSLGTYAAYLSPRYRGNARDYLGSLRRLRALPVPDLVLPGHPLMDRVPQSPRLSQKQWHALLDRGIGDMERLLARYEADGANFLDGTTRELLPGLYYLGDHDRAPVYCLTNATGLFLVDAPGGPSLVKFLAARFKERGWSGRKLTAVLLTSVDDRAAGGLKALVASTDCQVVAPKAGVAQARRLCPPGSTVLTEDDLAKTGWFEVETIPLAGRGLAPVAYLMRWSGKTVLVSGRIPVKLSDPSVEQLLREVTASPAQVEQYRQSLDRLARVKPDLWLSAVPVHGQNANLYDQDWAKVLSQNARLFQAGPLE
jgi:metallo-beta-lactamase class B